MQDTPHPAPPHPQSPTRSLEPTEAGRQDGGERVHPATGCVGKFQRRRMQTGWDEGEMKATENRGVGWQTRDSVCMHMYSGGEKRCVYIL